MTWAGRLIVAVLAGTVGLYVFGGPALSAAEQKAAAAIDFDRDVAPLLARHCLACHNSTERKGGLDLSREARMRAGGDSGAIIAPGDVEGSYLWERIAADEMPPERPLAKAEKQILKRWIAGGARWGSDPIDPFRFTTDARAGYNWWSLQPITRPTPPGPSNETFRNPIDAFVHVRRAAAGLTASPEADRRTLIRRLSFDLLGLPPTPKDVEAFQNDAAPDAYERLVERLLASHQYGERWARHWLDVIRFGESQGFERDKLRPNAWPYRDWVIEAFNRDLPYDEFARLQLAGDVLRPDDASAITATGFLVAGPYDEVGQTQQSAAMRAVVRADELEDIVGTVGQTFLGLTVHCARCHEHKFDPIRQEEYYQLTSALSGVRHGERALRTPSIEREIETLEIQRSQLQDEITALEAPVRRQIISERRQRSPSRRKPEPFARWTFDGDLRDQQGTLHGKPHGEANIAKGRLILNGKDAFVTTAPLSTTLTEKTLAAWVQLGNLEQRGGGVIGIQSLDGEFFDAIVFGEKNPSEWLAGSDHFQRTEVFHGPSETVAHEQLVHVAIVYHADGTILGYRNGKPYGKSYKSRGPHVFAKSQAQVVFGLRHGTRPVAGRLLKGSLDQAELYDRALTPEEMTAVADRADIITESDILVRFTEGQREEHAACEQEIARIDGQLESLRNKKVYAVTPKQPEVTHVLLRGSPASPANVVSPGGIAALNLATSDFGLPPDAPEGARRVKLAEWITSPENPLFARVIVNRLWHYHFGTGIVDSPNDFGFNGGRPTHPELLDFLASYLIDHDWSLKAVHRLILTSATYRQSSQLRLEAQSRDADNRLLWRFPPQRVEAEVLRDTILSVSGQLNSQLGGPSYQDFKTFTFNSQFYEMIDPIGWEFNRRTIYRTWLRSGRNHFLDAFDCPDPSATAPKRAVTVTPTQSLTLLNNSFVLRMSDHLADRVTDEAGTGLADQIESVYQLVYQRSPSAAERATVTRFVRQHGLAAFCRVLFNSNEFLFVE